MAPPYVSESSKTKKLKEKTSDRLIEDPLPLSNLGEGIVGWESQDDMEMPLNFSLWKKWILVWLLSAMTFLTPFASSILSPGIARLDQEFGNENRVIGAMTVSVYLMGYIVGPLILAPLSEIHGRKPLLGASNVFFCVWQIGCALAPNLPALLVFRFLAGVGGAGCMTLGGGIIGDVFRPDGRGLAMGAWSLGPLVGPTIGPLIGGFLVNTIGWRWDFWIVLIAGVFITVLIQIFMDETNHRTIIRRKINRLEKELGRYDLRSCYEDENSEGGKGQVMLNNLIRPLKMLFLSPLIFFLSLYVAFVYGVLYLLFTTIPTVFEETYGFDVSSTGLVYLSLGFGNMLGWLVITFFSDKSIVRLAQANNGVFEPEMRLTITMSFGAFLPLTFFWYGWSTYFETHWIVPILSFVPFGFGIIGLFLPITTYLVDSYPIHATSALAANNMLKSLVGATIPIAGPPMYKTLGLGWGNTLLGFLCLIMIPVPIVFYKIGARLRKSSRLRL